ncbi:unnamed protein product [Parajaminaea phylloscopi]
MPEMSLSKAFSFCVTPVVGALLEKLRYDAHPYKVVTPPTTADLEAPKSWAITSSPGSPISSRHVIRFRQGNLEKFGFVTEVLSKGDTTSLVGVVLIPASEPLGKAGAESEYFATGERFETRPSALRNRLTGVVLRYRYTASENQQWTALHEPPVCVRPTAPAYIPRSDSQPAAVLLNGDKYHVGDSFFAMPDQRPGLLAIFQVHSIRKESQTVTLLLREARRVEGVPHMLQLNETPLVAYRPDRHTVVRRCTMRNVTAQSRESNGNEDPDVFWTSQPLTECAVCTGRAEQRHSPPTLRVFDLFCGAGGLSLGLNAVHHNGGPAFETLWALEKDPISCDTFAGAHPKAKVFREDASVALKQLGTSADYPEQGQVDVLVAGPPCQGFTGLSRQNGPRHHLNTQVFVALAWVEALRPGFVVIENVSAMDDDRMSVGDMEGRGFVKMATAVLLSLGYSVTVTELQAAQYGAPQERQRLFLLASRSDLPTVSIPEPSHTVRRYGKVHEGCAPHCGISSLEAISDLPKWDWRSPEPGYMLEAKRPAVLRRIRAREDLGIPTVSCKDKDLVGAAQQSYASRPRNAFQRQARINSSSQVSQHQTVRLTDDGVSRVVCLPFVPGVSVETLLVTEVGCADLVTPALRATPEVVKRLDGSKPFPLITGASKPEQKCGLPVHPLCARTLTVRECARAQGFPDRVHFAGTAAEIHRQIGNAVPVPLAAAIGRSILASWQEAQEAAPAPSAATA